MRMPLSKLVISLIYGKQPTNKSQIVCQIVSHQSLNNSKSMHPSQFMDVRANKTLNDHFGTEPDAEVPCTPAGCVELLQRSGVEVAGKNAVILGRRGNVLKQENTV